MKMKTIPFASTLLLLALAPAARGANTFTSTSPLATARYLHTATLLPNGKVLVAGGYGNSGSLASAELYDPATGTWSATGPLATARREHTATLLPNGKVLVGGYGNSGSLASAELYDVGLGFSVAWQPQMVDVAFDANGRLVVLGAGFRGISSASGGNGSQDSPTSCPLVQLRRLDNEQSVFLLSDPAVNVTASAFTSVVPPALGWGYVTVTVYANGIPSVAWIVVTPPPGIVVEQPANSAVGNGGSRSVAATTRTPGSLTFTIKNPGSVDLTGLTLGKDGPNAADFTVAASPAASVAPFASTTFTIQFAPASAGTRTAALRLTNNIAGSSPFTINLTGQLLSYTTDTDGDGINDAQEFDMAALGFDWQVSQPALVSNYYATANGAGLYTTSQVQALNVGTPLLQKNPVSGSFTLTIGVQKATNLSLPFLDFPMNGPGASTTINGQGRLEFQFTTPDNAQFFRLEAH